MPNQVHRQQKPQKPQKSNHGLVRRPFTNPKDFADLICRSKQWPVNRTIQKTQNLIPGHVYALSLRNRYYFDRATYYFLCTNKTLLTGQAIGFCLHNENSRSVKMVDQRFVTPYLMGIRVNLSQWAYRRISKNFLAAIKNWIETSAAYKNNDQST